MFITSEYTPIYIMTQTKTSISQWPLYSKDISPNYVDCDW